MVLGMREPTYFILVSLANEPLHGYGIAKLAEALSDGRVKLRAGTLYGALDRLEKEGHIELDREEEVQGRPRRYFKITESGQGEILQETQRMQSAIAAAHTAGVKFGAGATFGSGNSLDSTALGSATGAAS